MTFLTERPGAALADRYTLDRELGRGGMATVYLARDVRHARQVAIKVLHPELAAVLGSERFLAEIKTTANLQHPHILPLFDSGSADGQLFYVMPFVEGETLRGKLDRETQLPIDDAVRIAREVADALQHAHERGVIRCVHVGARRFATAPPSESTGRRSACDDRRRHRKRAGSALAPLKGSTGR